VSRPRFSREPLELLPVLCPELWPERCFLAHSAEAGVAMVDSQERFTFVNPAFAGRLGYSVEELLGMGLPDLADEAEIRRFQAESRRRAEGQKSRYECTLRHRDGESVRFLVSASPVKTPDGRHLGSVAVVIDLTERVRVETELRTRVADENAIRQISTRCANRSKEGIDDAIEWSLGVLCERLLADGCMLALMQPSGLLYRVEFEVCAAGVDPVHADAREIMVGSMPWARQQIEERGFVTVGVEDDVPEEFLQRFARAGVGSLLSVPLTIGGEFLGMLTARGVSAGRRWNQREVGLLQLVAEIIANTLERRRVEDEMARARDLAEAGLKARSQFLANMSHEIRTPMNAVIGVADLLAGTDLEAEQREFVETILESGKHLLRVVNDIMDFSKIDGGHLDFVEAQFDLDAMVSGVVRMQRPDAEAKGLELAVAGDLPAVTVRGDEARLRQALLNLVSNAIKFTDRGGVTVSVRADSADDQSFRFEVRDTGSGIDPSEHARLFDPFVQVDESSTRRAGGTGLGLAICRRLVNLMGGEIGVDSRRGEGATFWFTVRLRGTDAAAGDAPPIDAESPATDERPTPTSRRILIVEDNLVNQKILLKMIERLGGDADVASDGYEALEAMKRTDYGLVFMDCQMPNLDGFQTTRQIRRLETLGNRRPVVALTANAMSGDRERCLAAGMDDYLTKPVTMDGVDGVVRKWLGSDSLDPPLPQETVVARDEVPVLDLDHLHPLSGGDRRFETRLLSVFLKEAGEKVPALVAAVAAGDEQRTAEVSHALKGAAASVGARRLADLAERFQQAGRSGNLEPVRDLVDSLAEEFEAVRGEITSAYDIES
jgi:PAS domain S-box-containing protein